MKLLRKKLIAENHKKKYEKPSLVVFEMTVENIIANSNNGFGTSEYIETDDSIFEDSLNKSNKYKNYEYGDF